MFPESSFAHLKRMQAAAREFLYWHQAHYADVQIQAALSAAYADLQTQAALSDKLIPKH
jgi:hypothetical protein